MAAAAIIAWLAVWMLKSPEPREVARFSYEVPEGQQLNEPGGSLAVSPNGRLFAYSTTNGIYLRPWMRWTQTDCGNGRRIRGAILLARRQVDRILLQ